jgi:phenylglyoxylate dehydrogenase epsilon subunit
VLRSLDDALALRAAATNGRRAVVLGAGLVGMHAAENLAQAGLAVTVIEAHDQVLPAYFDAVAAGMIARAFAKAGVTLLMGRRLEAAAAKGDGCRLTLSDGAAVEADLLVVATGVRPETTYLGAAGVDTDRGILVDERMRTSVAGIWAAGDVAQARDFYGPGKRVNGILPCAVEQGRIAGRDMAGDAEVKPFPGGVPINTYRFFGRRAVAVGDPVAEAEAGASVTVRHDPKAGRYLKLVTNDGRLRAIACVDQPIDAGIMWQLILRRVDLTPMMDDFLADPVKTGRLLMSRIWR